MAGHPALDDWVDPVVSAFHPHLSRPQATVLAFYSLGVVLAQRGGLHSVVMALIPLLGGSFRTLRCRLQEFYPPARAQSGSHRRELDIPLGFGPLWHWVLTGWPSTRWALARDATSLGDRLTVRSIHLVDRGCALPVAWKVLRGHLKHPWKPEWLQLLQEFHGRIPAEGTVIVLSDRGLSARGLFQAIRKLGWHPLRRVRAVGHFRRTGSKSSRRLTTVVPTPGRSWQGRGTAFPSPPQRRLDGTLWACWEPGQKAAWFVLTDLEPECSAALWYGMGAWMEHGFKRLPSDGGQGQQAPMSDPERVERLWLVRAVAPRSVLAVGGELEDGPVTIETFPALPPNAAHSPTTWRRGPRTMGGVHPETRGAATEPSPRPAVPGAKGSGEPTVENRRSGTTHRIVRVFPQG